MKKFMGHIVDMLALSVYAEIEGTELLEVRTNMRKIEEYRPAAAVCVAR